MDDGTSIIDDQTYEPWLDSRKASIDFFYWTRYKEYLLRKKGISENIVDKLDIISDELLDLLGNPAEEKMWKRRGLIMGDIQSGKTQNYNALINKAADSGYKLIIILSGIQEALRKQTQERIDYEFVGLNSNFVSNRDKTFVGVGSINKKRTAFPITNVDGDFNKQKAEAHNYRASSVKEPIVFVIKKNVSILEHFIRWIKKAYTINKERIDYPLLLIDDEADNASVNTKNPDEDPTKINQKVRKILHLFNRSSYVAITATPFANIFINLEDQFDETDDLFPSDFIYSLPSPTNYIGCDAIFGDNAIYAKYLINITDADGFFKSSAGSKHNVKDLPLSLCTAIYYFLLCNVVRDITSINNDHRTMLINVSQYTNVQETTFELVEKFLRKIQDDIKAYSKLTKKALQIETIKSLHDVWNDMDLKTITNKGFLEILPILAESTLPITIRMVNSSKKLKSIERLDYDKYKQNGLRTIVVGGNSLSRGLTLEGLCVSYFYRESKMYDTLLQMGRWFGYRVGYKDIVKIWMCETTQGWFCLINDACEELRSEINYMNKLQKTPKDFGLKILDHPGTLMITAANKMRTARSYESNLSLSGQLRETAWIPTKTIKRNHLLAEAFLDKITNEYVQTKPNLFENVSSDAVIDFISKFASEQVYNCFNTSGIVQYIDKNEKLLNNWYVYVVTNGSDKKAIMVSGIKLKRVIRKMELDIDGNIVKISGNRSRVGAPGEVKVILNENDKLRAKQDYINEQKKKGEKNEKENLTIPDHIYLRYTTKPILIFYFMLCNPNQDDKHSMEILGDNTVVGISLGFPRIAENEFTVRYKINLIEQRNQMPFIYDDDMEGDEDYEFV